MVDLFFTVETLPIIVKYFNQGGGGEEATRSGTEKRCSHNLQSGQSAASQRSSKAAVCFLMISTLALSVG